MQSRAREPYLGRKIREKPPDSIISPELARRLQRRMRDGDQRRTTGPKP
jgi:hypothetical protein